MIIRTSILLAVFICSAVGYSYENSIRETDTTDTIRGKQSYIYWGSANGYSSSNKTNLISYDSYGRSMADLNGDGYPDIISYNKNNSVSCVNWGSESGYSIADKIEFPIHNAKGTTISDLNGDGHMDLLFSSSESYIYWGSTGGYSDDSITEIPVADARGLGVTDLNGDGYLDLVFNNFKHKPTSKPCSFIFGQNYEDNSTEKNTKETALNN